MVYFSLKAVDAGIIHQLLNELEIHHHSNVSLYPAIGYIRVAEIFQLLVTIEMLIL